MSDDLSKYEELSARAERGGLPVPEEGRTVRGAEAAAQGAADLMAATGTGTPAEAAAAATMGTAGRPRVGASARGQSPPLSFRVAPGPLSRMKRIGDQTGKTMPNMLREAVDLYIATYGDADRAENRP